MRVDQRVTWFALLVPAGATFVGIPFDRYFLVSHCVSDGVCQFWRRRC
ncbi:hypothetical protein [Plantactinospora sp. KLBMP9567]|nr:hypothetical protein [Plantactinospora sp. KLBMP9567]MDW5322303.1 hypothetical protein [Plantactinospora sp. KLBMP9567]